MAFFFAHLPEGLLRVVCKDGFTIVTTKKCHRQATRSCRGTREQCCLGLEEGCPCRIVCHNLHGGKCTENEPICCSYRGDGDLDAAAAEVMKMPAAVPGNVECAGLSVPLQ